MNRVATATYDLPEGKGLLLDPFGFSKEFLGRERYEWVNVSQAGTASQIFTIAEQMYDPMKAHPPLTGPVFEYVAWSLTDAGETTGRKLDRADQAKEWCLQSEETWGSSTGLTCLPPSVVALASAPAGVSTWMESPHPWARQTREQAVEFFLAREATKLECVLAIKVDARQDALDILFVVKGDLFDSERAVLPLMRRVRDKFSNIPFDVMVLPASQYSKRFRWGQAPKTIFQRIGHDEHGARAR